MVVELGVARRNVRAALKDIVGPGQETSARLRTYFESAEFVDRHDAGPQVWYVIVPLPITRRLDVARLLRDATPRILKLIVETINDGHIDDPWMHPGDYDWTEHPAYAEVSMVRGRQGSLQSLIVSVDGTVAVRDSSAVRGHYSASSYEAMLETTLEFADRFYRAFDLRISRIAIQTYFVNARELKMGFLHGIGSAWYRFPDHALIANPTEPIVLAATMLHEPRSVVAAVVQALPKAATTETMPESSEK
ncbi:MAG TPA: hypothetical protein VIW69_06290 [Candidatus Elarobacter sp.]